MRWDRLLWGVEFRSESGDAEPMLIGRLWALDLGGELIEHLQKTGRLKPCFYMPALADARSVLAN